MLFIGFMLLCALGILVLAVADGALFSERLLPCEDVVSAEPGYAGITIKTRTGQRITAGAVQRSNASRWSGWHTRADEVAADLNARAKGGS